jgi:hypothetical protein
MHVVNGRTLALGISRVRDIFSTMVRNLVLALDIAYVWVRTRGLAIG